MAPDLSNYDGIIFDLDGVIFRGSILLPNARELIEHLQSTQKKFVFLTNHSGKRSEDIVRELEKFGISDIKEEQAISTSVAIETYLKNKPEFKDKSIYVFGPPALIKSIEQAGFQSEKSEQADVLICGFNRDLNYEDCTTASLALRNGAFFIAANLDRNIPTERGLLPGTGSLIKLLEHASERTPDLVMGKPSPDIYKIAFERLGVQDKSKILMIGDRLDSDIQGAINSGINSCLVYTGVTQKGEKREIQATYEISDLTEILF